MARYEIGVQKATGTAIGFFLQLRAGAGRDLRLFEVGVSNMTGSAPIDIGLIRPTAVGATFTSTSVGAPIDNASAAGVAVVDTAATTPPTIGTNYMRRWVVGGSTGAGFIWTFPLGINIPVSSSVALWLVTAPGTTQTLNTYFDYDE